MTDLPTSSSPTVISYSGSVQTYTVAQTGIFDIIAYGGAGGSDGSNSGGEGGEAGGDIQLTAGETIEIVVGGEGSGNGGGGGTFVYVSAGPGPILLLAAGGGGGAGADHSGGNASTSTQGGYGNGGTYGAPGSNGGGGSGRFSGGGGGGGFQSGGGTASNGGGGGGYQGNGFVGGSGGGAFGGGGGGANGSGGGGGGYSGGDGDAGSGGGGGGASYITSSATNTVLNGAANHSAGFVSVEEVSCFLTGTRIATPEGGRAVETLRIGDLVTTADGESAPVRWIGHRTLHAHGKGGYRFLDPLVYMPIRIRAGALGENLPVRDLLVSTDHALLVDGLLVQAGALVNGISVTRQTQLPESFTYYHIELANHALVLAEGVPAETFVDNVDRMGFDNWAEHEALYGHEPSIPEMAYPRVQSLRQLPLAVRRLMRDRARVLTAAAAGAEAA